MELAASIDRALARLARGGARLGRARPAKLEFLLSHKAPAAGRLSRERFRARFQEMLAQRFPDETPAALTTAADLEHSLSGSYVRGLLRGGSETWAILCAAPSEHSGVYDGLLTFGLIWLHRA